MRDFILADNQEITRAGLETVLERCGVAASVCVCAHARSLTARLAEVPSAAVILDYTLFDFYGAEQMLNLAARYDRSSWLLFSEELGRSFIRNVGGRDRFGIVMKGESLREIEAAIRAMAQYRTFLCEYAGKILAEESHAASDAERLTASESSILREIALGRTTKEIAVGRCLSFHTVNSHRKNIFRKLGVNNVQEAIRYALRAGIIDMADYNI